MELKHSLIPSDWGASELARRADLDQFYRLIETLQQKLGGARRLADPAARTDLPRRGVYFFFEDGELREDGRTPRVVRIGTHAVSSGSKTTLWGRLSQHRGRLTGAHAGGGNHRGSIFRLHVGTALLKRGLGDAAAASSWGARDRPAKADIRHAEEQLELIVSEYIRAMPFVWVEIDDPSGKESHRKLIEANAIALLSNLQREAVDAPSPGWLGRWADRRAVRESGLWNVDHVEESYDPSFLTLLERYVMGPGEASSTAQSQVRGRAMLIGLVSCTKAKTAYAAPARELYSPSALFRGALRALEGRADVVYVLSAKYGLLHLDQVVEPYDQTLKDASEAERRAWAEEVCAALVRRHGSLDGVTVEFHCGEAYREPLEALLNEAGAISTCPVDGLAMGQRLAYYAGGQTAAAVEPANPTVELPALHLAVAGMHGRVLATGSGAPFKIAEVGTGRVVVVPESTRKPRPVKWAELDGAWSHLLERGSITLAEVREIASEVNPAYVFAILAEVPGVKLEPGRPMRLRVVR